MQGGGMYMLPNFEISRKDPIINIHYKPPKNSHTYHKI